MCLTPDSSFLSEILCPKAICFYIRGITPLIWYLDDGQSDKRMSREKIMRIFRNDLGFQ
jgi:hypothetical protein